MRKKMLVTCLVVALSLGLFSFGVLAKDTVKLRYVSLAWQEQSIEANKAIVAEWNRTHPDIQVEYVQGDWGSIHDYMITAFETGEVPDIFHYESAAIIDFAKRGYLTNLSPLISENMEEDIFDGAWGSVEIEDGNVYGVPFLWESKITLYNKDLFAEAGITVPTIDNPWTWEDLREAAIKLTKDSDNDGTVEQWGAAFGLKNPASKILNLSLGFGGGFYAQEDGKYVMNITEADKKVLRTIKDMMYADKSTSLDGLGQTGSSMLPGFYAGKYAMLPAMGVWARQQIVQNAPEGFNWGVLPPIEDKTPAQGAATQTLSIPSASEHQEEAMEFIEYFLNAENMAKLALGDWLFPTRQSSLQLPEFQTEENGWKIAVESVQYLEVGPWELAPGYAEWKSRVANPILQELFANRLTIEEAVERLEKEGNHVLDRYQK